MSSAVLCVSSGRVEEVSARRFHIDSGGVRATVAGDHSSSAELAFTYGGPSTSAAPLASGELRRQIGLKLRAQDTCNVVYVMWHIEPTSGIFVSVKRNARASVHSECGAGGYESVEPHTRADVPRVTPGTPHVLRADLDGRELRVSADGLDVWRGVLPAAAFDFDGPAGLRTDNGIFEVELRVPGGDRAGASCAPR